MATVLEMVLKEKHLSQAEYMTMVNAELAEQHKLNKSILSRYVAGKSRPRQQPRAQAMAKVLGVTVGALFPVMGPEGEDRDEFSNELSIVALDDETCHLTLSGVMSKAQALAVIEVANHGAAPDDMLPATVKEVERILSRLLQQFQGNRQRER